MSTKEEQAEMPGFEPNPKRYALANRVHASTIAINDTMGAFQKDLQELRVKHGVPDVVAVVGGRYVDSDGDEVEAVVALQYGNALKAEPMAAYLYGKMQAEHVERMAKYLKDGKRTR